MRQIKQIKWCMLVALGMVLGCFVSGARAAEEKSQSAYEYIQLGKIADFTTKRTFDEGEKGKYAVLSLRCGKNQLYEESIVGRLKELGWEVTEQNMSQQLPDDVQSLMPSEQRKIYFNMLSQKYTESFTELGNLGKTTFLIPLLDFDAPVCDARLQAYAAIAGAEKAKEQYFWCERYIAHLNGTKAQFDQWEKEQFKHLRLEFCIPQSGEDQYQFGVCLERLKIALPQLLKFSVDDKLKLFEGLYCNVYQIEFKEGSEFAFDWYDIPSPGPLITADQMSDDVKGKSFQEAVLHFMWSKTFHENLCDRADSSNTISSMTEALGKESGKGRVEKLGSFYKNIIEGFSGKFGIRKLGIRLVPFDMRKGRIACSKVGTYAVIMALSEVRRGIKAREKSSPKLDTYLTLRFPQKEDENHSNIFFTHYLSQVSNNSLTQGMLGEHRKNFRKIYSLRRGAQVMVPETPSISKLMYALFPISSTTTSTSFKVRNPSILRGSRANVVSSSLPNLWYMRFKNFVGQCSWYKKSLFAAGVVGSAAATAWWLLRGRAAYHRR